MLEVFEASEIKLMDHIPEADKSDSQLAKVLEEHELAFLMPLLSLQKEMETQLASETSPTAFAKWIGDCVETRFHNNPGIKSKNRCSKFCLHCFHEIQIFGHACERVLSLPSWPKKSNHFETML